MSRQPSLQRPCALTHAFLFTCFGGRAVRKHLEKAPWHLNRQADCASTVVNSINTAAITKIFIVSSNRNFIVALVDGRNHLQKCKAPPQPRLLSGRDASCLAPPAQIRTSGIPAYGSHLGGFGVDRADLCGASVCRMFNQIIAGKALPGTRAPTMTPYFVSLAGAPTCAYSRSKRSSRSRMYPCLIRS